MNLLNKEPDKDSVGYRAGQALVLVVTACLITLVMAGTYKLIESWF